MKTSIFITTLLSVALSATEIYTTFDVEAMQESDLTLTTTGVIQILHVDIGDHVKKGDVLLSLDNEDLKLSVELAESDLKLAEVNHRFAKQTYERYEKVKDVIDDDQYEQYLLAYEKSMASLNSAKANLAYKKAMFKKSILRAPYNGVISKRHKEIGDGVSGAMLEPIITLVDDTKVKLVLSFDEKYWQQIEPGLHVTYKVDGSNENYEGKIVKIYPTVDANTRKAFAEVHAKDLMPGLFGEGMIEVK
ncbi:MAG: efflux RND transporter periplasmic adaptor subunit [Campylobacterota bacterium]|nr:efflux RND transporter periplasmic adaptor subunit [Campylobacterota bacterium]